MASPAARPSTSASEDPKHKLIKQIRAHEVAIAELNNLSSSRAVYQKNGAIFFRTTIKAASTAEQNQLDLAKAQLQKMNSGS